MLRVATWNINSVRLREGLVLKFLRETQPDTLCLQELKSPLDKMPTQGFADLGYPHIVARGQPGYNGVAILSRAPIDDAGALDFCEKGDARHVAGRLADGTIIHNLYVPSGGDQPDRAVNEKFDHKLRFVAEMQARLSAEGAPAILVGDLNIAPLENDVWSHKQMLSVVSHTPVEVEALTAAQCAGGWVDVARQVVDPAEKLYSWWSYRARDWEKSDRGRRLDHIWTSRDLAERLKTAWVFKAARGWEKPSDHAPVLAEFD